MKNLRLDLRWVETNAKYGMTAKLLSWGFLFFFFTPSLFPLLRGYNTLTDFLEKAQQQSQRQDKRIDTGKQENRTKGEETTRDYNSKSRNRSRSVNSVGT